jgi:hypothetical protein
MVGVRSNTGYVEVDVVAWEVMVRGPCPREAADALLGRVNAEGFSACYREGKELRSAFFHRGYLLLNKCYADNKHFTRYLFLEGYVGWTEVSPNFLRDTPVSVPVGGDAVAGFQGLLCPR